MQTAARSVVPTGASGTVNLLTLVNVSQTIGSASHSRGVDRELDPVHDILVSAQINGKTYPRDDPLKPVGVPISGDLVLTRPGQPRSLT